MPKLTLTDTEWCQLIDGESEDSQLHICCANISALRDTFVSIMRNGRRDTEIGPFDLPNLKQKLKWVADSHDLTPLLKKVCEQSGFDPSVSEHTGQGIEP